ncbi:SprT-like domain-containing protein [uncultured Tateyamaria sp.]|uniref:SprT-like domain-containing protein n=1 Tax=uncultured Tateyamaria sp. TaxID=455651 RepID=UPI00342ECCA9
MNPAYFAILTIENNLSTMAHEMVHLWQFHHGKPSRRGYHNKEWALKMEGIGLIPSDTGRVGGKKVGQSMDHYILENGPFSEVCAKLITQDFRLSWLDCFPAIDPANPPEKKDRPDDGTDEAEDLIEKYSLDAQGDEVAEALTLPAKKNSSNRAKYRCPTCEVQVWGKPGLTILCGAEECSAERMPDVTGAS